MKLIRATMTAALVCFTVLPALAGPVIKTEDLSVSSQTDARLGGTTGQVAASIALLALLVAVVSSN
jgi:hypothetical protein